MNTDDVLLLARDDFACYCVALYRGFEFAAFHRAIIEELEEIERERKLRAMLCLPPRHSKSLTAAQLFPAFYLGRHPDRSIIGVNYGQELADAFGRKVRSFVNDPLHQQIFPGCRLSSNATSAHCFETTAGGGYFASGREGPIVGRGASRVIVDDPLKNREEAESELIRNNLW